MTFSDPAVAAYVNENFVSAWHNRGPGFMNHEFGTEKSIFSYASEAYPTKNICTFFLTPEGKVFHYVSGYYSPDLFLRVLQTVMTLRSALFDESLRLRPQGLSDVRRAHAQSAKSIGETVAKARLWDAYSSWREFTAGYRTFTYRGETHTHTHQCAQSLADGLRYLASLHSRWTRVTELPDLEEVRYAYLSGNSFTEESEGSRTVEEPSHLAVAPLPRSPEPPPARPKEMKKKSEPAPTKVGAVKFPEGRSFAGVVLRGSAD